MKLPQGREQKHPYEALLCLLEQIQSDSCTTEVNPNFSKQPRSPSHVCSKSEYKGQEVPLSQLILPTTWQKMVPGHSRDTFTETIPNCMKTFVSELARKKIWVRSSKSRDSRKTGTGPERRFSPKQDVSKLVTRQQTSPHRYLQLSLLSAVSYLVLQLQNKSSHRIYKTRGTPESH